MSLEAATAKRTRARAVTASYTVRFRKNPRRPAQPHQEATTNRVPRVTRMLALAHKIDGMIRTGEIKDLAEAARLIGVTRARMTQIANLLLLAPRIQESLLNPPRAMQGHDRLTERDLRKTVASVIWSEQRTGGERTETLLCPPL